MCLCLFRNLYALLLPFVLHDILVFSQFLSGHLNLCILVDAIERFALYPIQLCALDGNRL